MLFLSLIDELLESFIKLLAPDQTLIFSLSQLFFMPVYTLLDKQIPELPFYLLCAWQHHIEIKPLLYSFLSSQHSIKHLDNYRFFVNQIIFIWKGIVEC
jgi:hypothetical protein